MTDYLKLKLIILSSHIIAVFGLVTEFDWIGLTISVLLYFVYYGYGMCIGYHRVFTHKSFIISDTSKWLMLFVGSLSTVGSSISWVGQHRCHHAFSDIPDKDPYYGKIGFWTKLISWVTYANRPFKITLVKDLLRDPAHMFMHKHYFKVLFGWIFILSIISFKFLVYGWALPIVLSYSAVSLVGVLGHVIGNQPYHSNDNSRDSHLLSIITLGENYQNYHHLYPSATINGKYDIIGIICNKFFKPL